MINLFKLHVYYQFSWKVIYISLIILLVSIMSFLLFSRFYLDYDLLVFSAEYYNNGYYFESINYLKIIIVLYNMFLVINGFVLSKYDIFLIARRSKKQIISSKIITLILGSTVLIIMMYLLFIIIGLFLTPYTKVGVLDLAILGDLLIFSGVYLLMFIVVYIYCKSIYSLLLVVVGFFLSDLSIDYNSYRNTATMIAKGVNLIFINIGHFTDIGYSLFYGKLFGLILMEIMFIIIFIKYCNTDF